MEIDLMTWALRWKDRIPYTLPRGMVFQNGRRMIQLATYEDLVRLPGSYWVDMEKMILHIHPFRLIPHHKPHCAYVCIYIPKTQVSASRRK
jgi:hypothetical protein